jgi:hypothetical protein
VRYECEMLSGYTDEICEIARSKQSNEILASALAALAHPVWFRRVLWPKWQTTRGGWWVRILSWKKTGKGLQMEYKVVDIFGHIKVTDIRRNIQAVGPLVKCWETERSLGQDQHLGAPLRRGLVQYWEGREGKPEEIERRLELQGSGRAAFGNNTDNKGLAYWAPRVVNQGGPIAALGNLELDWGFESKVRTEVEGGVIVRKGGRAYIEGPRQIPPRDTLRRAGPRGPSCTWTLDEARWAWLGDITVSDWKELWLRQVTWEEKGGRTISWAVTEWLRGEVGWNNNSATLGHQPSLPMDSRPGV